MVVDIVKFINTHLRIILDSFCTTHNSKGNLQQAPLT